MTSQVLLERGDQLAELQQHAAAAHVGRDGRLVLIGGVAGSGKTSLLNAFRAALPPGVLVLAGGCEPLSAPRPLGPLLDFAHELGHELVDRLGAPLDRHQVFLALLGALRAEAGPKVLILEDLHWADDATLDLIRYCGRRLSGTRTLLLATYRHDETLGAHPLRRVLGDLAGFTAVHRLEVPELSPEAVAELTEGSALDPDALYDRTGGNPFFVTEVLADGGSALPAKVEDAVLARASRLSAAGRSVLEVAAVIGSVQDVQLLERLAEEPAGVEECLEHGMLVGDGLTTAFRHEIAREAIIGSLTPSRLMRLHAQVLGALQDEYGADASRDPGPRRAGAEPYARLAHHAAGAGDAERTVEYALAAGRAALKVRAMREAKVQFQRVLSVTQAVRQELLAPEEEIKLLGEYATVCLALSDDAAGLEARSRRLELLRLANEPARTAVAQMEVAEVLWILGRRDECLGHQRQALDLVRGQSDSAEVAQVYMLYAHFLMIERQNLEAERWAKRAAEAGHTSGANRVQASAYNVLVGGLSVTERVAAARSYHRRLLQLIEDGNGMERNSAAANAKTMLGSGLGEVYRLRPAETALMEARQLAAKVDFDAAEHYAVAWLALAHLYLGRWAEAGDEATWVLSRPSASLATRVMAAVALGRLRLRRGDPEVWPVLDEALEAARRTDQLQRLAPVRAARAEAYLAAGDLDAAATEALAALPLALEHHHSWFVSELVYLARGAGVAAALPDWAVGPFALQLRGEHGRAAARWRRLGCPFEEGRALADSGQTPHLLSALRTFRELGAQPAAARVAEELRRRGVKDVPRQPRPTTRANPAGLTQRESQVLALLAQGLRNVEIAERHGVSPRTVGHQVSAVLAKLAVSSRAQAVLEARRRGLI